MAQQRIAIAGFGIEGRAAYRYYKKQGATITLFDNKDIVDPPEGVEVISGPDAFDQIANFDIVVRGSPAIRPDRLPKDAKVTTVTKEFFDKCPVPIIGVTGTKGKGTTSTLIHKILLEGGKKSWLVGNIGEPALDVLDEITPDGVVVYELSSFQLWDLKVSPHIAVVLMIEPDHFDVHHDMKEYVNAKSHITKHQLADDVVIYHPDNQWSSEVAEASRGKKIHYQTEEGAMLNQHNDIVIEGQRICSAKSVGLLGRHNLDNVCAAITAAWHYTKDVKAVAKAVGEFKGLPHRLERIANVDGVDYYDDSIGTTPSAAVAALEAFKVPKTIIVGGFSRDLDFGILVDALLNSARTRVITIGATGPRIHKELLDAGFDSKRIHAVSSLDEAAKIAHEVTPKGGVVLLSPANSSFDMFKNFSERGTKFQEAVAALGVRDYQSKYHSFRFTKIEQDRNKLSFYYQFDNDLEFKEELVWPEGTELPDTPAFNNAAKLYHVLAGASYYKAYPAPKLVIETFTADAKQLQFFHDTYLQGLGEYLYKNKLHPEIVGLFENSSPSSKPAEAATEELSGNLVLFGGGKDSLVTADLLNKAGEQFTAFRINSLPWIEAQIKKLSPLSVCIERKLDARLFEANKNGALNGHIPITGIVSAAGVLEALRSGKRSVITSNEASANIPNTEYLGLTINHQYSKSLGFEAAFGDYVQHYIHQNLQYFSLLRPWSELRIVEYFAEHLFETFSHLWSSSNHNFKLGSKEAKPTWDPNSPKSASVFGMLAPFVERKTLINEFGANLFERPELTKVWSELLGTHGIKPFECVADVDEMRVALIKAKQTGKWPELNRFAIPVALNPDYRRARQHRIPDNLQKLVI